jgi:hypothetical protein
VACRPAARQRPRYKQIHKSRCLVRDAPLATHTTVAQQKRNGVSFVVRVEMLLAGQVQSEAVSQSASLEL